MAKVTAPPNLVTQKSPWDMDDLALGVAVSSATVTLFLGILGPVVDIQDSDDKRYNRGLSWSYGWSAVFAISVALIVEAWLPLTFWLLTAGIVHSMYEWTRRGI